MRKPDVAVVTTTLNEEKHIKELLDALTGQTLKPTEIIVVDAGSTDKTITTIRQFDPPSLQVSAGQSNSKIRLYVKKGANRSLGRNIGISKAKSSIIAVTDAGCIPQKNWLEKITKPIRNKQADSVAGYYSPISDTFFQQCIAPFVAVLRREFNPKVFLPSSRSVAFTKEAWEKAGKYPQQLNYCEDLVFAKNLKLLTKMVVSPGAIVHWRIPDNFFSYFHTIKNYAFGDVQAHYQPHLYKILSVYLRYIAFILWYPLFFAYLSYIIFKHRSTLNQPLALIYLPLIQLTTDAAIITGSLKAMFISPQKT